MDRFEAMSLLMEAIDAGSLSAAGRKNGVPLATVSRKISELEAHLNTRLLLRGNRRLELTDSGRVYIEACRRILEDVREAERAAAGEYRAPTGELVITAPTLLGRLYVLPVIADFMKAYPEVTVKLVQIDGVINLLEEHVDVAVRIGDLPDSSLIAKRVGDIYRVACASPDYLAARGIPESLDDLVKHDCIAFEAISVGNQWVFTHGGRELAVAIQPKLKVNTADAGIDAAIHGLGIARALSYQVEDLVEQDRLQLVLRDYESEDIPVSLVYPGQRMLPLKLRAFLDFAAPRLREILRH